RVLGELVEAGVGNRKELHPGGSGGTPGEKPQCEERGDRETPAGETHRPTLGLRIFILQLVLDRRPERVRAERRRAPSAEADDRDGRRCVEAADVAVEDRGLSTD